MDVQTLKLDRRVVVGKKVKQLRRKGVIPVHLYGAAIEPENLQVDDRTLNRMLVQVGANVPVSVEFEDQEMENICFVREVQRHPVTEEVIHVDFMRVNVSQTVSAEVPLALTGVSPAVELMAGTLLQNVQSLSIEALPMNMPAEIPVDVSVLVDFETALLVSDIEVPENVTVLNDPGDAIVRVAPPRLAEAFEEEEAAEEALEEGEEGADAGEESAGEQE